MVKCHCNVNTKQIWKSAQSEQIQSTEQIRERKSEGKSTANVFLHWRCNKKMYFAALETPMYATLPQERNEGKKANKQCAHYSDHFPSTICANDAYHILIQFSLSPSISLDFDRDHQSNNNCLQNIFNFLDKTSAQFFLLVFATLYGGQSQITHLPPIFMYALWVLCNCFALPEQCNALGVATVIVYLSFFLSFYSSFEQIENAEFGHRVMCLKRISSMRT